MSKVKEYAKVIQLRKLGLSYNQIKLQVQVSKSTLSRWLKDLPLSKEQIDLLRGKNHQRIERYRESMKKRRETRLNQVYLESRKQLLPLSKKELLMAGLFLYLGEGNKSLKNSVSLNNTDPAVMKFYYYWLKKILKIPEGKIKVYMHLYGDMDIENELNYWSKLLKIPRSQFIRPYIKESLRSSIQQKGYGHGTCALVVHDTRLKERIILGLKSILDHYGSVI